MRSKKKKKKASFATKQKCNLPAGREYSYVIYSFIRRISFCSDALIWIYSVFTGSTDRL